MQFIGRLFSIGTCLIFGCFPVQADLSDEWDNDLVGNWQFVISGGGDQFWQDFESSSGKVTGWIRFAPSNNITWTEEFLVSDSKFDFNGNSTSKTFNYKDGNFTGQFCGVPRSNFDCHIGFQLKMTDPEKNSMGGIVYVGDRNYSFELKRARPVLTDVVIRRRKNDNWSDYEVEPYLKEIFDRGEMQGNLPLIGLRVYGDYFGPSDEEFYKDAEFYVKTNAEDFYQPDAVARYYVDAESSKEGISKQFVFVPLRLRPNIEPGEKTVWINGEEVRFNFYFAEDKKPNCHCP